MDGVVLLLFVVAATAVGVAVGAAVARRWPAADVDMAAAIEAVTAMAAERLGTHAERASGELGARASRLDAQLAAMTGELARVTTLVRQLEGDREQKFGALAEHLRQAAEQTARLADTTSSLRQALSSTSARGQWGERMAEDVLRLAGFIEGVNYRKQLTTAQGRPDFTFLLPRGLRLHMDVKFPLDNYLRYLDATTTAQRDTTRAAFLRDVRARVSELAQRDYAAGPDCVNCVLLFIPNEQLYAFIQSADAAICEEALRAQVVVCSPLTLFAVLAVVRQAVDNFVLERTANEILAELATFDRQWAKYVEHSDRLGRCLESANRAYNELTTTRARALERPLERLAELRRQREAPGDREVTTLPAARDGPDALRADA